MITRDKLLKLLNLTTSDQDGEALNAIRAVNAALKRDGITWEQICDHLTRHVAPPRTPPRPAQRPYNARDPRSVWEQGMDLAKETFRRSPRETDRNPEGVISDGEVVMMLGALRSWAWGPHADEDDAMMFRAQFGMGLDHRRFCVAQRELLKSIYVRNLAAAVAGAKL